MEKHELASKEQMRDRVYQSKAPEADKAMNAHSYEPCTSEDHRDSCCYVTGPSGPMHVDAYAFYIENEWLAKGHIRARAKKRSLRAEQ